MTIFSNTYWEKILIHVRRVYEEHEREMENNLRKSG